MEDSSSRFTAAELRPGNALDETRFEQMEQPLLMTHPQVPCTVAGDGMHDPVRYGSCGNKPAGLEKGDSALRPHPNLPAIVLKDGLRDFFR